MMNRRMTLWLIIAIFVSGIIDDSTVRSSCPAYKGRAVLAIRVVSMYHITKLRLAWLKV
jgi:hypothetical protein